MPLSDSTVTVRLMLMVRRGAARGLQRCSNDHLGPQTSSDLGPRLCRRRARSLELLAIYRVFAIFFPEHTFDLRARVPPVQALECDPPDGPAWTQGLNASQRLAVDHRDGPLLISAGAGTGKTRTLVSRLARLLDDGVPPERILLVTFSRRAAAELTRRVGQLTDPTVAGRVVAGTFHSVAHRVLRRYGTALGLAEGFSVLGQGDGRDLLRLVRAPVATDPTPVPPHRDRGCRSTAGRSAGRAPGGDGGPLLPVVPRRNRGPPDRSSPDYTERKRAQHLLDLEDLLLYWRAAVPGPDGRARPGRAVRPGPRRRVPGHQPGPGRHPARPRRPRAWRSPSWGTTPRPSTRSGPPPSATSSTSRSTSPAPRRSPWSRTTGRPARSSNWPTP